MEQHELMQSVSGLVRFFQTRGAGGKSKEECQEVLRKAIGYIINRLRNYRTRVSFLSDSFSPNDLTHFRNEVPHRLDQLLLPRLKERTLALSLAIEPMMDSQGEFYRAWYKTILSQLIGIERVLERFERAIALIWTSLPLSLGPPGENSPYMITPFRSRKTKRMIKDLLTRKLRNFLVEADSVLADFRPANPSSDEELPKVERWRSVLRLTAVMSDRIDEIRRWLQKPLIAVAKEEWQGLVEQIDNSLRLLLKHLNATYHKLEKGYQSDSDYEVVFLDGTRIKFVQAGLPVIKLCRVYFNKLSRPTNSMSLIFVENSMRLGAARLDNLLNLTQDTAVWIDYFVRKITQSDSRRREIVDATVRLAGSFLKSSSILKDYWDSLLDSGNHAPPVDRERIEEAQNWLECWNMMLNQATGNLTEATRSRGPGPAEIGEDTSDELDQEGGGGLMT
ncbi:hypothetical protein PGTUg99_020335 [Puccinia graminis f. sp. tritici]|uniref:Uncharacterized protein n=2 Tax=Puccinia graminis f. sp. tritici TaxID=56615 RepID=A0A5B0R4R5_PUCGR|nr:hypothetical protein PGTUg99_020335 [Puccinia graminis f. sp. tritici]